MIVAVGNIQPEYADLMNDKLVHGYVSINFDEIGKKSYALMRAAVDGKPIAARTFTANVIQLGR